MKPNAHSRRCFPRSSAARESRIETLEVDVILVILEHADISSPLNLALTGPVLYTLVLENEAMITNIAVRTLANTIGSRLMPFAIALHELRALGERLPRSFNKSHIASSRESVQPVVEILGRHIGPGKGGKWREQKGWDTLSAAAEYARFDNVVRRWTKILAKKISTNVVQFRARPGERTSPQELTHTETLRIHRALYIYELVRTAFPWGTPEEGGHAEAWGRLCAQVSPWEMEQTRSLQPLLLGQLPATKLWLLQAAYEGHGYKKISHCYRFLLSRDLKTLLGMYGEGKGDFDDPEVAQYCRLLLMPNFTSHYDHRIFTFAATEDTGIFEYDEEDRTNLDATRIFHRYPDEDMGPRAWWYYQFLCVHLNLGGGQWQREPFYKCRVCMPFHGYVFCDYATLSKVIYPRASFYDLDSLLRYTQECSRSRTDVETIANNWAAQALSHCRCEDRV
ncbi:hypothetical protein RRF57_009027 [Xylaria bambusicola]|uniref:Uncharacterized protein n=1 Tax=Xylaria bambusicola TaxID=326684 RepID=A0AAN7UP14_9PEZI